MNKFHTQRGAAMLLFVIFFMVATVAMITVFSRLTTADAVARSTQQQAVQTALAADAGAEDVAHRNIVGLAVTGNESLTINGVTSVIETIVDGAADVYTITATSSARYSQTVSELVLQVGNGTSFNFGVQSGTGGFRMANNTSVQGNVFSNGQIIGQGSAIIKGDVISAGPGGLIEGDLTATGTARARVIRETSNNSLQIEGDVYAYTLDGGEVDGDAYIYERIGSAVVHGNEFAHEPEEDPVDLPMPDATIEKMKQEVVDYGTVIASTDSRCDPGVTDEYYIDTDITLEWVKIECDLRVKKQGSATVLTLGGTVWVEGDVVFEGGPTIEAANSVGARTTPIIADNPSDRITSSRISVENGTTFSGSGDPKSYIMLISQNEDAEVGSGPTYEDAIFLGQSAAGDLLVYAGHGEVVLGNSVSLKEVTGYLIELNNGAEVIYKSGLVNTLFTSGPGGGFTIGSWTSL